MDNRLSSWKREFSVSFPPSPTRSPAVLAVCILRTPRAFIACVSVVPVIRTSRPILGSGPICPTRADDWASRLWNTHLLEYCLEWRTGRPHLISYVNPKMTPSSGIELEERTGLHSHSTFTTRRPRFRQSDSPRCEKTSVLERWPAIEKLRYS